MYEIEKAFEDTTFVLSFLVQIFLLIVFLRMAWNLGKIRKHLVKDNSRLLLKEASRLTFKGKNNEAAELYLDYIYNQRNMDITPEDRNERIANAMNEIKKLGVELPPSVESFLNKQ